MRVGISQKKETNKQIFHFLSIQPLPQKTNPNNPPSSPTNLATRNRLYPRKTKINHDVHNPNDPKDLGEVGAVVAEDDGEDDAAEVSCCACGAGDDSCVGGGVIVSLGVFGWLRGGGGKEEGLGIYGIIREGSLPLACGCT